MNLPNGILENRQPLKIHGKRILLISDLHVPYHYKKGLELALSYGKKHKCDTLIINGDFLDFYQISRFDRSPDKRSVAEEIQIGLDVLRFIRKEFPKQEIIFVEGNHDERLSKYINKNSELFGIPDIKLENLLKLKDFKIKYVNDKKFVKAGKLIIAHGHEFGMSTGGAQPARAALLKTFSSCIFGHFHKTSEYIQTKLDGEILGCWSTGHLSDPSPLYMPVNGWNFGFSFVEVMSDGDFQVSNMKIYNERVL